jgi:putative copper export protein
MAITLALRVAGLVVLVLALRSQGAAGLTLTAVGLLQVLGAFTLVGHTATHPQRWLLGLLLLVHLLIVAFWFGALVPLLRASSLERANSAGIVIAAFSAVALWFVPVIFVAGVCLAIFLVGTLEGLRTTYGALLLAKVALFAVLLGLGALNKWRLGPGVARADPRALAHFRRSIMAEYLLIAVVLGVTAVLTTFYSPD